jgi:hypothetical protein
MGGYFWCMSDAMERTIWLRIGYEGRDGSIDARVPFKAKEKQL